jgi:putative nucleotidyltransferase with HDIG domain
MTITASRDKATAQYLPIYLDSLRPDTVPAFDLYLDKGTDMVLYRSACTPFSEESRQSLLENNITRLYVAAHDQRAYSRYLEDNLRAVASDTSIKESIRAGIIYDSARFLVEDLFAKPTMGENIRRSEELVESTVGFVLTGRAAFESLLKVMSFDYSTYTHSINVCALSLVLGQHVGIRNPKELKVLGTGALLHDIGKTRIADSILNKLEPLTAAEKSLIRKHPEWGYDIVKDTDLIEPDSYHPIIQHHERENRSGYPKGMSGQEIHFYSKIVGIADVFDAMTTKRVYRSEIDAYPALKIMFADEGAFDAVLLEQFARMLAPERNHD